MIYSMIYSKIVHFFQLYKYISIKFVFLIARINMQSLPPRCNNDKQKGDKQDEFNLFDEIIIETLRLSFYFVRR